MGVIIHGGLVFSGEACVCVCASLFAYCSCSGFSTDWLGKRGSRQSFSILCLGKHLKIIHDMKNNGVVFFFFSNEGAQHVVVSFLSLVP